MGYYMEQFDQAFRIAAENKAAAFEALKGWAKKEAERNAILYAHLDRSPIGNVPELEDALSELEWEAGTDDGGSITEMRFCGEKLHDEDEWLDAIAPHVDKGSQLMMRGEDGCCWCWYFDGENCTTYPGEVVFPGMPEDENAAIYTHDEAALIVEEFENALEKYGVRLPSPEDDERDADNEAALYGSTYSDLLDAVEEMLIDLLNRHVVGAPVAAYAFSGKI